MIVNLTDLDRILKEEVDRPLDHRNLNQEIPEFATTRPDGREPRAVDLGSRGGADRERGLALPPATLKLTVTPTFSVEMVSEREREDFLEG